MNFFRRLLRMVPRATMPTSFSNQNGAGHDVAEFRPLQGAELSRLRSALYDNVESEGGVALLTAPDTSYASTYTDEDREEDERTLNAIRSVPTHYAGFSTLSASMNTEFRVTSAQITLQGQAYNPVSNSVDIRKSQSVGTTSSNTTSGGGDIAFSFQQTVGAGVTVNLDLTGMTDLLNRASQSIARVKAIQFRLLSGTDDSTITPTPTLTSTCVITNNPPSSAMMDVPADLFGNGGSGLTLTLTASAGVITAVAIGAAGSGYPKSSYFTVVPQQAGGSGAVISVATDGSGVPTTVAVVYGGPGTGSGSTYTSATVPSCVIGHRFIYTGGAWTYFDPQANGFCVVSSTAKKIALVNLDGTHAITVEVDVLAATS